MGETQNNSMIEEVSELTENYIATGLEVYDKDHIVFENEKNIELFGNDEQRTEMFKDWSAYLGEITNPENTVINTIFKAKYSPLNEVLNTLRPIMSKYGLNVIQIPYMENEFVCLKSLVTHKNGGSMSFPVAKSKLVKPNNAVSEIQAFGSISSYLRRFTINAIFAVMGEIDTDGNDLGGKSSKDSSSESKNLKPIQQEVVDLITKNGGSQNENVMKIVKEYIASGNPFKITNESKLNELKTKLESYKKEEE